MSGPSAGSAVDHYLVDTLLPSLFPAATVLRVLPGTQVEQDVVSLQSTTVDDAQVCMGPQRRRDETMRVTLLISCTRPGTTRCRPTLTMPRGRCCRPCVTSCGWRRH